MTQEEILEDIIEDHDLEYTQALRVIVEELDLQDEAIRYAIDQLLQERRGATREATDRQKLGLVKSSDVQAKIVRAFRRRIRYHALLKRIEWLESELRWTKHKVQMSELAVAKALEAEEMPGGGCVVDPLKMALYESDANPHKEMIQLAKQLAKLEEYRLETIAEDEILPTTMRERARRISKVTVLDAESYIIELADALLSLRPKNRIRAVRAVSMSGEPQEPPSEDIPSAVQRLRDIRFEAEGVLDEIWAGANPRSIGSDERDRLDLNWLEDWLRGRL